MRGLRLARAADLADGLLEVGVFLRGPRGVRLLFGQPAAFGRGLLRDGQGRRAGFGLRGLGGRGRAGNFGGAGQSRGQGFDGRFGSC